MGHGYASRFPLYCYVQYCASCGRIGPINHVRRRDHVGGSHDKKRAIRPVLCEPCFQPLMSAAIEGEHLANDIRNLRSAANGD